MGKTADDYRAAIPHGPAARLLVADRVGGATRALAGETRRIVLDLPSGDYFVVSTVAGSDKVTDAAKGMYTEFFVVASTGPAPAAPASEITATLQNATAIALTPPPSAGSQTWQVVNSGTTNLTITLFHLEAGKTLDDLKSWLKCRPGCSTAAQEVAGVIALAPSSRAWMILDLSPGDYVAYDDTPTATPGLPTAFSVR